MQFSGGEQIIAALKCSCFFDIFFLFQKDDVQDEEMAEKLCIRKKRFMQFASVQYNEEYYMTPRDFLFSVMFDKPGRKLPLLNE